MTRGLSGLAGKTVVVTGAARGVGEALSLRLAAAGARVALVGLEPDELAAVAARCGRRAPARGDGGERARAWGADITDGARMTAVAAEIAGWSGGVDVVVANAGIAIGGPFADADPAAFERVIGVNLLGSAATARAFLPALTAARGYYLQIASLAALAPAPLMAAYCASKAGVEAFAHVLRAELAHHRVGVGVAYLTWTDTDMVRAADEDEVLRELRARQPWPAGHTAPLGPAADRIVAGIARRAPHVYAQPWLRALAWLPRTALPAIIASRAPGEVARLEERLRATAGRRLRPVGPGGRAAMPPPPGEPAVSRETSVPDGPARR
ncbi:MAG TPA: SDR family oxidoreductase [Streptosporangiaceae bacterium]|nr:SDR family oxidoreductase [Streptosporangiaceae bacterium]